MSIRIIVTGGTFDKEYNELDGTLFFRKSHIPEMLRLGRCRLKINVQTLFMIDSLYMTAAQRRRILRDCLRAPEKHIVVTHGTDTMVETAQVLGPRIGDKTVVLTGAMVPYKFGSSDGMLNLGSALSFAQSLPPGVYVAMNGRYFLWNNVRKNRGKGEFEPLSVRKMRTGTARRSSPHARPLR
jgi:L-asparaginase